MSARGQFIPARSRSAPAAPSLPIWEMAAVILALFLINLVAIAAFLATVAQAVAQEATKPSAIFVSSICACGSGDCSARQVRWSS